MGMRGLVRGFRRRIRAFRKNDVIGFGKPNDLAAHLLRSQAAEKYGLFGIAPMWGGVRVHEFYPPLSSILIRLFTLKLSLALTVLYAFLLFTYFKSPWVGLLFISSYFFISPLIHCGRFPEVLGHVFVINAFLADNTYLSGIFLGLAGLTHPLAFLFGLLILIVRKNLIVYLLAFSISGWWLIQFFMKRKQLGYLNRSIEPKVGRRTFFIYWISLGAMFNTVIFITQPWWLGLVFSIFCWLCPWASENVRIKQLTEGPFLFLDSVPRLFPRMNEIKSSPVVILRKNHEEIADSSLWEGIWAIAAYLLKKGIVVYNAYPETEVPLNRIVMPKGIRKIVID